MGSKIERDHVIDQRLEERGVTDTFVAGAAEKIEQLETSMTIATADLNKALGDLTDVRAEVSAAHEELGETDWAAWVQGTILAAVAAFLGKEKLKSKKEA